MRRTKSETLNRWTVMEDDDARVARLKQYYPGFPEISYPASSLLDWVEGYLIDAERRDLELDFTDEWACRHPEATIRMFVSAHGYILNWDYLSKYQRLTVPPIRRCPLVQVFYAPCEWMNARLFLPRIIDLSASRLFMAISENDVEFDVVRRSRKRWSDRDYKRIVNYVASDMEDDYCASEGEYLVVANHRRQSAIRVLIEQAIDAEWDVQPDENGIVWNL